jgi:hypothetical protein
MASVEVPERDLFHERFRQRVTEVIREAEGGHL